MPKILSWQGELIWEANCFGGQIVLEGKLFWGANCFGGQIGSRANCFGFFLYWAAFCHRGFCPRWLFDGWLMTRWLLSGGFLRGLLTGYRKNGLNIRIQQEKNYQNDELFLLWFEKVLKMQGSVIVIGLRKLFSLWLY